MTFTAPLTVVITWAHADADWDPGQVGRRAVDVYNLAELLRCKGLDAEIDLYHQTDGEEWSHWGPQKVRDSDRILIVTSQAWKDGWEGRGDPTRSAGAAAEADVLHTLFAEDRKAFVRRVRVLELPGSKTHQVPDGLTGIQRYRLAEITEDAARDLIRDLTDQPAYPKGPLGPVPRLAQAHESPAAPDPGWPTPGGTSRDAGKGTSEGAAAGAATVERQTLEAPLPLTWVSEQRQGVSSGPTNLLWLHLITSPTKRLVSREQIAVADRLADDVRAAGSIGSAVAIETADTADSISAHISWPRQIGRDFLDPIDGRLEQVSVSPQGQISIGWTLPHDGLGAILDPADVKARLVGGITIADRLGLLGPMVGIGAQISHVSRLTEGNVGDLGRSQASMGMNQEGVTVEPEEALSLAEATGNAEQVADEVTGALLRSWRHGRP